MIHQYDDNYILSNIICGGEFFREGRGRRNGDEDGQPTQPQAQSSAPLSIRERPNEGWPKELG